MTGMSRSAAAFAQRPDDAFATLLCPLPSLFRHAMGGCVCRKPYPRCWGERIA